MIVYIVTAQGRCEGVFSTEDLANRRIAWLRANLDIYASWSPEKVDSDIV